MSSKPTSTAPALYVDEDCNFSVIRNLPIPDPVDGEVLVKVLYSGVNPADVKHAPHIGIRSVTLGYDFCGRVVRAAGENASSAFKPDDLVAGYVPTGMGKPMRHGAHQEYLSCPIDMLFKVPDNLPQTHAASLTVVLTTAADGLYNIFGYPLPEEKAKEGFKAGPLLIWGASASVGICMLQLARESGASPIFVTASPGRHEMLTEMGATRCFDYNAPNVISQIKKAAEEAGAGPIRYAADCAGSKGEVNSAAQTEACVDEDAIVLSVVAKPDGRIKMPLASANTEITLQLGGGPVVTIPARLEDWGRMWRALMWSVENYGTKFSIPVVDVFKGSAEEALKEVKKVADQGKFGKLVLEHPLL